LTVSVESPTWARRLEALGNAVVPACAYEAARFAVELVGGE